METLRVKVEKVSIDLAVVGEAQAALVERSMRARSGELLIIMYG